jgi:hypothetical protein
MQLTLKDFTRNGNGTTGDHMVAQIQQTGEDKTITDKTDVIIDTAPNHRDIRISDGNKILNISLGIDYTIETVYENDVVMTVDR